MSRWFIRALQSLWSFVRNYQAIRGFVELGSILFEFILAYEGFLRVSRGHGVWKGFREGEGCRRVPSPKSALIAGFRV